MNVFYARFMPTADKKEFPNEVAIKKVAEKLISILNLRIHAEATKLNFDSPTDFLRAFIGRTGRRKFFDSFSQRGRKKNLLVRFNQLLRRNFFLGLDGRCKAKTPTRFIRKNQRD